MTYILSRLLHGLFVLLGVSVVVFGLTWLTGDPASVLLPLNTPPDQVQVFRHNMGLDEPIPVQYAAFLGRAVRGDFGVSFRHRTAALPLVLERLPVTLRLMGAALLFAVIVALPHLPVRGQSALAAVLGREPTAEHHPARDRRWRLLGGGSDAAVALESPGGHVE